MGTICPLLLTDLPNPRWAIAHPAHPSPTSLKRNWLVQILRHFLSFPTQQPTMQAALDQSHTSQVVKKGCSYLGAHNWMCVLKPKYLDFQQNFLIFSPYVFAHKNIKKTGLGSSFSIAQTQKSTRFIWIIWCTLSVMYILGSPLKFFSANLCYTKYKYNLCLGSSRDLATTTTGSALYLFGQQFW